MKQKLVILCVFAIFAVKSFSTTWHIKQDGSGDFTSIQEGIIASADSDTVIVYPGAYFENIDYLEKSLTVASLYVIIPEDSLITQTVIDGNGQFRCVTIDNCLSASLIGFTIQNGMAYESGQNQYGGGIYLRNPANAIISNCKIKNNKSFSGGGLHINHGNTLLIKNTISNNWGVRIGGGISVYGNDTIVQFSETELNNIYLNYSSTGSDISITEVVPYMNIYVDTLTVLEPDYFFINPSHKYSFYGLNSKINQIDQDLYVAPNGDNNNNGLSLDEPLQTLSWAQTLIKRNDECPNTIHLASGIYSPSANNQIFPLNIKNGVIFKGISIDETILDAEEISPLVCFNSKEDIYVNLNLQNLLIVNAVTFDFPSVAAIDISYQVDMYLKNVSIQNSNCGIRGAIFSNDGFYHFENIIINNNSGAYSIDIGANYQNSNPTFEAVIINSIINNNHPGIEEGSGGAIKFNGHSTILGNYQAQLVNCEISNNLNNFYDPIAHLGGTSGLYIKDMDLVDVVNCTFGDNTLSHNTGCTISVNKTELNLYNTILYNNDGYSLNLWEDAVVNISNSLIEGGDDNVNYYYPLAIVNWMEGNLDEDPFWLGTGDFPYYLQSASPCIDAGTLDLPNGIELPEFDLAGNPRIYGDTIDMGAYEWQGVGIEEPEIPQLSPLTTHLSNYPNPFNPSTTIKLELAESGKVELAIYNIKGQKVKTLLDCTTAAGTFNCVWNGKDSSGKLVSSGEYIVKLKVNGEEKAVRKIMLVK